MAYQTFLRFPHLVDVYNYSEASNAAGQIVPKYYFSDTVNALVASTGTARRTSPYVSENDEYSLHVPRHFEAKIQYDSRLQNMRDARGNVLEIGPLEVTSIMKRPGYSGRTNHLYIIARVVIEAKSNV